jgi:hypothetical protein
VFPQNFSGGIVLALVIRHYGSEGNNKRGRAAPNGIGVSFCRRPAPITVFILALFGVFSPLSVLCIFLKFVLHFVQFV